MAIWQKYAKVLVEYSTEVKKGDLVIISSDIQAKPLVQAIYKEVLKKGAHPIVKLGMEGLRELYFANATDEQLEFIDPFTELEYDKADKFISIGAPYNTKNLAKTSPDKIAKRSSVTERLSSKLLKRAAEGTLSWVICNFPTNALAQEAKMSLFDYEEFLLESCHLNIEDPVAKWKEIGAMQDKLIEQLNPTKKLRIVGEKTDLTLSTEGRKWISCCGLNNFPDGEVFTSPVEDSAEGEIYFDFLQYMEETKRRVFTLNSKKVKLCMQPPKKEKTFS